MGYDNVEIFAGKDRADNDIYGGFRFNVDVERDTEILMAILHVYLERMYPASTDQDVLDRFTDDGGTDLEVHTMDVGPATGWLAEAGTLKIKSNQVNTYGSGPAVYSIETGTADGTVRGKIYHFDEVSKYGDWRAGLVFRCVDSDNFWWFGESIYSVIVGMAWQKHCIKRLAKVVDGAHTVVWTRDDAEAEQWHTFAVHLNGNSIIAEIDGAEVYSGSDSTHNTATKYGLYSNYSGSPKRYHLVDDFEFIPSGTPDPLLWARCDDVDDSEPFCEKMDFDSGSTEFTESETLTGASSGATATVFGYYVATGSWAGGNAAGRVYLTSVTDSPFISGEALNGSVGGADMALADGANHTNLPDERTLTTNTQSLGDISGWTEGAWNATVDIKLPLQEVINRPGWTSGNGLSVILTPQPTEYAGSKIRLTSEEGGKESLLYVYYGELPSGKQEYYDAGTVLLSFGSNQWLAQTFSPSFTHNLQSVRLYLKRDGVCGTVTIAIRNTSGGQPSGGDIVLATLGQDDIPTDGGWVCVSPETAVSFGWTYAIVVRAASGDSSSLSWMYTVNEPPHGDPYSRGELYFSADSGSTWTAVADIGHPAGSYADADFEEWAQDACS